jgi:hypothetical protein
MHTTTVTTPTTSLGRLGAVWGIVGVEFLLIDAIVRLAPRALDLRQHAFTTFEASALLGTLFFFAGVEGYKGFQKSFSPRVVARAFALLDGRHPLLCIAAPLFTMALIAATPRRLVGSWALVTMIVGFVLLIRVLPDPWRGIVDAGVVVGLSWGALSIAVIALAALRRGPPDVDLAWSDARTAPRR